MAFLAAGEDIWVAVLAPGEDIWVVVLAAGDDIWVAGFSADGFSLMAASSLTALRC